MGNPPHGTDTDGWWMDRSRSVIGMVGVGQSRCRAVTGGLRPEERTEGEPWVLSGSSLWTELCVVPTAAFRAAQPSHPRNGMRSLQDCQPIPHLPHPVPPPQAGWRSGWRPAGRGGPSPMPIPQAWPSGWGIWCGCACRDGPTRGWWWRRPRPVPHREPGGGAIGLSRRPRHARTHCLRRPARCRRDEER